MFIYYISSRKPIKNEAEKKPTGEQNNRHILYTDTLDSISTKYKMTMGLFEEETILKGNR